MNFNFFALTWRLFVFEAIIAYGIRTDKDRLHLKDDFTEATTIERLKNLKGTYTFTGNSTSVTSKKVKMAEAKDQYPGKIFLNQSENQNFTEKNNLNEKQTTVDLTRSLDKNKDKTWNVEKNKNMNIHGIHEDLDCHIPIEDILDVVQATVAKALTGFHNTDNMEGKFNDLYISFTKQLNTIKNMITSVEEKLEEQKDMFIYSQKQLLLTMSKECSGVDLKYTGSQYFSSEVNNKNQKFPYDHSHLNSGLSNNGNIEEITSPRDPEILKFNSSIHTETTTNGLPKKVFTYYWRVSGMTDKLLGWNSRKSFRSQSFYIFPSGYRMYLRVFFRKNEDNFYVRVGLTKGEFDDSLNWPFPLKHKIHILDQTKGSRLFEDIASRLWDPNLLCSDFNWQKPINGDNHECAEVGFPHDILEQREYIRHDALVIKLTVYLEN